MSPNVIQMLSQPLALETKYAEASINGFAQGLLAIESMDIEAKISNEFDRYGNKITRTSVDENGTALVPFHGVVSKGLGTLGEFFGYMDISKFTDEIVSMTKNESVSRIIVDMRSPGGTVVGTATAARALAEAAQAKPVMVYSDDLMASAAYYVAAGATQITVGDGAVIGSIGVFTYLVDYTEAFESNGVKAMIVRSGEKKAIGAYGIDQLTEDKIRSVQDEVDALGAAFRSWVTNYRDVRISDMQGQTFDGNAAVLNNLADSTATNLADAINAFVEQHTQ